jgi:pyruvate/2-oxoglutarate dehydrogenase complex dihydrolipoamide acyltransferase (E2) component
MAFEFLMPKMGMTMEEGTIISWRKKIGDHVDIGEVILDIQTDKVRMEVESPAAGILLKILAAEGAVVPVNIPIAYIGEAGEEYCRCRYCC